MVKSRALVCLLVVSGIFSGLSYAVSASADRITGDLTSGTKIQLKGNVHGLARPEFDLGRADGSRMLHVVSLSFHPSAAQQQDLDLFLSQLSDRSSPNYHKYMTPAQFADRFGMTQNDINKVVAWLQSEGFINITVSNSRNQVSFDGTVAQVESTFALEMHNYLVNGEVHLANAGEPSVPAALAASVLSVGHLHDFSPKPRMKAQPHLTSYLSGNHYLSPGDYATIYNVTALYTAGDTGSNQKIAVIGQSTVATSDLNNFRSAAQLPASTVTMNWQLVAGTTQPVPTPTRCSGDEGESDLDLEWSGGVAKSASITFVFAPLSSGDTCASRQGLNVWNALQAAIDNNVAPFISTSYGYCEAGLGLTEANTIRGWAVQGVAQGQTITASSGDSGAADCDTGSPATQGLAVDVPASIPEVTGAGGNEFVGDTAGAVTGNEAAQTRLTGALRVPGATRSHRRLSTFPKRHGTIRRLRLLRAVVWRHPAAEPVPFFQSPPRGKPALEFRPTENAMYRTSRSVLRRIMTDISCARRMAPTGRSWPPAPMDSATPAPTST